MAQDSTHNYSQIARDGLWNNNIAFSQMLALCPLLAVTGTATNGLGMGLATLVVLITSGLSISLLRGLITQEVRIPVFVLIIAAIVTNCAILGRAESFAFRNPVMPSVFDGLMMGLGFTLALVILGVVREILGSGTLFANASLLLGDAFSFLEITLIPDYRGFLLMILPPGGFLVLGFLLAGRRVLDSRLQRAKLARDSAPGSDDAVIDGNAIAS
jgi:electron transport complex protein RnfE